MLASYTRSGQIILNYGDFLLYIVTIFRWTMKKPNKGSSVEPETGIGKKKMDTGFVLLNLSTTFTKSLHMSTHSVMTCEKR